MAIFRAPSELGDSALRPKKELAKRHFFLRKQRVCISPSGSGKSSYYYLLSRAFDFLRQRTALRESIASSRLYHGPHNFEPRRKHRATCPLYRKHRLPPISRGKKKLEERNTFLRSDDRKKTLQSEQLTKINTLLADATAHFHFIQETMRRS